MSANKIDDLIENIINDFYTSIIKENKELKKIYSETNFIKSQKYTFFWKNNRRIFKTSSKNDAYFHQYFKTRYIYGCFFEAS